MKRITISSAISAATGYKAGRQRFQDVALRYVAEQALLGNADAASRILTAAGMLNEGRLDATGRRIVRYLTEGIGLPLAFKDGGFRMVKDWQSIAVDMTRLTVPFWAWAPEPKTTPDTPEPSAPKAAPNAPKAARAPVPFDAERRAAALIRKGMEAGLTLAQLSDAFAAAIAAAGAKIAEIAERPEKAAA